MMSMQNECLVKFLGAGVMSEPEHGLRVLFTVQVFSLDAMLLFVGLASFQFCTGVHVRQLIGSKDLEPAPEQCDMGRETAVVQGYSQGMAPQLVRVTDWSIAGNGFCAPFRLCPS